MANGLPTPVAPDTSLSLGNNLQGIPGGAKYVGPPPDEDTFKKRASAIAEFFTRPEAQAALLQFAISAAQPRSPGQTEFGAILSSVGEGAQAAGRVKTIEEERELKEREQARKERETNLVGESIGQKREQALLQSGTSLQVAKLGILGKREVANIAAQARRDSATITALSRETVQTAANEARLKVADKDAKARVTAAEKNAQSRIEAATIKATTDMENALTKATSNEEIENIRREYRQKIAEIQAQARKDAATISAGGVVESAKIRTEGKPNLEKELVSPVELRILKDHFLITEEEFKSGQITKAQFNRVKSMLPIGVQKDIAASRGVGTDKERTEHFKTLPLPSLLKKLTDSETRGEAAQKGFVRLADPSDKVRAEVREFEQSLGNFRVIDAGVEAAKALVYGRPITGLAGTIGGVISSLQGNVQNMIELFSVPPEVVTGLSTTLHKELAKKEPLISNLVKTGEDRALLRSVLFNLTLNIALSRGVRGRQLSNSLIETIAKGIGTPSANRESFARQLDVLKSTEFGRIHLNAEVALGGPLAREHLASSIGVTLPPEKSYAEMSDAELDQRIREKEQEILERGGSLE